MIIHGFSNEISGLRFEWAWQHPERSRRLQHVRHKKTAKENRFQFNLRILGEMLNCGPWKRLALTVQWLKPSYAVDFHPSLLPPAHMPIQYGPVVSKKVALSDSDLHNSPSPDHFVCCLCRQAFADSRSEMLTCIESDCLMKSHIICLADHFLINDPERVVPLEGECPRCGKIFLWADMIRKLNGCYQSCV